MNTTTLLRISTLLSMLNAFVPSYAQSSWRTKADSAYGFKKSGDLVRAQLWVIKAAQAAKPADPADSLWQAAVKLSLPLADSVEVSTLLKAGRFYLDQNNIDKAKPYLLNCRLRSENLHLPIYYLDSYAALALVAARRKDYSTAQQLYTRITTDSFALEQPVWRATGLVGLAEIASINQKFDSVGTLSRQVLFLLEQLPYPEKIRSYVQALRLLAKAQLVDNNLSESEKTIDKAYAIVNTHYPNDPIFIDVGYQYAYIYGDVNDERALEATHKSQQILQKQVNYQEHPYYLALVSNRVGLLEALSHFDEAAQVADSVFERHPIEELSRLNRFDQFLFRAFRVYMLTRQLMKAAPIAEQAQRHLAQQNNGGANPSRLHDIIGRYYQSTNQWIDAIHHFKEEVRLDSVDQGTSYLNHSVNNRLAICQAAAGQRHEALTTFRFLTDQLTGSIRYDLWLMTESERLNYLSTAATHGLFWHILRYVDPQSDELILAYNYKLLLRGASLRTGRLINQAVHENNRIDSSALQKLIDVQSQLASQRIQLTSQDRQRLVFITDSLNRRLGNVAHLVRQASRPVSWSSIQARLKSGEAAIEIIRYENFLLNSRPADSTRYAALIIRPGWSAPQLVDIPDLANSETAIVSNYFGPEQQASDPGEIYSAVWQPISSALGPVKRVYVAVDGIYQMISLPTLFNAKTGKHLLDETEVVVLNSTQDLLDRQPYVKPVSAELIGHPAYRLGSPVVAARTAKPSRGRRVKLRNGLLFDELPYTKIEVEQLARQFQSNGIKTTVRTETNATEQAVWQWRSPTIVHIATHGFFRDSSSRANSNSLLSCGLALAGAADTTRSAGHADGILTGYEASLLNLHKTELVVLSACRTGVGDYIEGEGIYGLQRAFLLAGSKAVLTSLWEVGDQVTQRFMAVFYQNWLSGLSKPAALRQTQRTLRREYPQAHSWGAFVLLGQ